MTCKNFSLLLREKIANFILRTVGCGFGALLHHNDRGFEVDFVAVSLPIKCEQNTDELQT